MNFLGREILPKSYPLFIAEISCNHVGKLDNALTLIAAAKKSKADFVKIQIYSAEEMTLKSDRPEFKIKSGLWKNSRTLYDLYKKAATPKEWIPELFAYAKEVGIPIFSSVFGMGGLEALEKHNCQAYKISSFEFNHIPLIEEVAKLHKPMILSTSLANLEEIGSTEYRIQEISPSTNRIYMHCVSLYPCALSNANLGRIKEIETIIGTGRVGFSDHTKSRHTAGLAACMGAKIIEKHFYIPEIGGEDAAFSFSPKSFKMMVNEARNFYQACLSRPCDPMGQAFLYMRSIYVVKDIKEGEKFTKNNIQVIRPIGGMSPKLYNLILSENIPAKYELKAGTPLNGEMVRWKKMS